MDAAELIINSSSSSSSGVVLSGGAVQAGSQGAGPLPDAAAAQAAAAIKAAVDEGYMAALTISRTNADALVRFAVHRCKNRQWAALVLLTQLGSTALRLQSVCGR